MSRSLSDIPRIETERLRLRPLELHDAAAFRAMTDEPAITEAIHFLDSPFTLESAEKLIRGDGEGKNCFWGAWLSDDPVLVGTVGAHLHGADEIEIGYWFASASRGRGLATEAVRGVITALVDTFPDRIIFAECRPENEASWRLLERVGFDASGASGQRPGRRRLILGDIRQSAD